MLRELGKTRQVLKSVLGRMGGRKRHEPLFLGAVRESDTMVECTPETVHKALTEHFELWYAMPPQYTTDPLHTGEWHRSQGRYNFTDASVQPCVEYIAQCHI